MTVMEVMMFVAIFVGAMLAFYLWLAVGTPWGAVGALGLVLVGGLLGWILWAIALRIDDLRHGR